ncbi:hypothetical protein ACP4OV_030604 [Aristida adscensionis]
MYHTKLTVTLDSCHSPTSRDVTLHLAGLGVYLNVTMHPLWPSQTADTFSLSQSTNHITEEGLAAGICTSPLHRPAMEHATTVALLLLLVLNVATHASSSSEPAAPVNKSCVTGGAGAAVNIGYGGARASAGAGVSLGGDTYRSTCPRAEEIVRAAVERAVAADPRMAASLLRLHFHDCFVNGCDGSVLLDDKPFFVGEKTAVPNANSLRGFEVIDAIKDELERECPETVSCADVLAIAARDSVVASGGPSWQVEVGRKDSRTASLQGANINLPAPTSGVATLVQKFRNVGLTTKDMVALSGAHTIGKARCTTFSARLAGVGVGVGGGVSAGAVGASKDLAFLQSLQQLCAGSAGTALAHLDLATPATFDNQYYINLLSGDGLLPSDQALASSGAVPGDEDIASLVAAYAFDASVFFQDFAESMLRMGRLSPVPGSDGEVRRNCRVVNSSS